MPEITRRDFLKFTATFAMASSLPRECSAISAPRTRQEKLTILTASGIVLVVIPLVVRERGRDFVRGDGSGIIQTLGTACIARCEIDGYPVLHVPVCHFPCPNALVVNAGEWIEGGTFSLQQFILTDERG
jgi:hypothetical protein